MAEDWKPGSNVLRISSVSIAYQKSVRNTQSDPLIGRWDGRLGYRGWVHSRSLAPVSRQRRRDRHRNPARNGEWRKPRHWIAISQFNRLLAMAQRVPLP